MKGWMRSVLKVFPIRMVVEYILDYLADLAKDTKTEIDDKAVQVVRVVFDAALINGKD